MMHDVYILSKKERKQTKKEVKKETTDLVVLKDCKVVIV